MPAAEVERGRSSRCVACHGRARRPFCRVDGHRLFRCLGCGVIFVEPLPDPTLLNERYARYTGSHPGGFLLTRTPRERLLDLEDRVHQNGRWKLQTMARFAQDGGSLLDVGTNTGIFPFLAARRGWKAEGTDLSPHRAHLAQEVLGVTVRIGTLDELRYPAETFDAVWASHVLEHVPRPDRFLHEIRRIMKPGGAAYLEVPNIAAPELLFKSWASRHRLKRRPWRHLNVPSHLYQFSPRSLRALLDRCGLEVVHLATHVSHRAHHPLVRRTLDALIDRTSWGTTMLAVLRGSSASSEDPAGP